MGSPGLAQDLKSSDPMVARLLFAAVMVCVLGNWPPSTGARRRAVPEGAGVCAQVPPSAAIAPVPAAAACVR
jgi:hypothetical protein